MDNYDQIYETYKNGFVAIAKDENQAWSQVADDPSLFGLYRKLKDAGHDTDDVHITLIHE